MVPPWLSDRWKAGGIAAVVRGLTVEQWQQIDADYRVVNGRTSGRDALLLVLVALVLTAQRYFGNRLALNAMIGSTASLPFPGLWPPVYWAWLSTLVYLVPPLLFTRWVCHARPSDHGFTLRGARQHLGVYLALFLLVVPLVILASGTSDFLTRYPIYVQAGNSWAELLIWELSYGLQFLALEYFFRGFTLFTLARGMGASAIFVMMVPYTMLHFVKPLPETIGAILAGIVLGTVALRTRSIVGGVLIHLAIAWTMDLLALWRKGALEGLFLGAQP